MISISKDMQIPEAEFANQGNAILGIRDSGKSYTATWLAERLLDAGIPFVAFDPIGVWRNLKLPGKNGGKGYEVVVAGDDGDLALTPESAPEIVRAAMRENIPLVIDLYSMSLSKADWKRIVETCVRILLFENKRHGLRHVFIEEAAEFCPQRVGPDVGRVYAEIEKLARMGGNAGLGYTLINQRAEEVNKAVLELCDCLFLHRQKGRHSITALGKWLDAADATGAKQIVQSMPSLGQGECWVWSQGRKDPIRVQIPQKRSHHPDRRNLAATAAAVKGSANVSGFVSRLTKAIATDADKAAEPAKKREPANMESAARVAELLARIEELERECGRSQSAHRLAVIENRSLHYAIGKFADELEKLAAGVRNKPALLPEAPTATTAPEPISPPRTVARSKGNTAVGAPGGLPGPEQRILDSLATWLSLGQGTPSNAQVAWLANYSPSSTSYTNPPGALRSKNLIEYPSPDRLSLSDQGQEVATPTHLVAPILEYVLGQLPGPEARILRTIAHYHPAACSNAEAAAGANYTASSTSYTNPRGALRSKELITYPTPGVVRAAEWLFSDQGKIQRRPTKGTKA